MSRIDSARGKRILLGLAVVAGIIVAAATTLWLTAYWARQSSLQQLLGRSDHALNLYVANIRRQLSQYQYLPQLLADDSRVLALLRDPDNPHQQHIVDKYLQFTADASGAAVAYVMTTQGETVASSNWRQPDSFIGANYGFRPYFQQAMAGRLGRYYALGSSSHRRGYYFAYPVRLDGRIAGAVVVKVPLDSLEAGSRERHYEFVVTGRHGVAFLSTQPEWRYHALHPLSTKMLFRITASQRYLGHPLPEMNITKRSDFGDDAELLTLGPSASTYLKHGEFMPEAGWWVYILSSTAEVSAHVWRAVVLAAVVLATFLLTGSIVWQRGRRLAERRRYEQATMETAAALDANRRLTREIEEHHRTEAELRRTRDELVQAGKLAAIGQLAASINHELNQPLTSIRFFADNAHTFLDRARLDSVRDNLRQIDSLAAHMGAITHQLKQFSRRSPGRPVPVSLVAVVDGALALLAPRLKRERVVVDWQSPDTDIQCRGDLVRLEQVVVNLVGNAMQAMAGQAQPRVEVVVTPRGSRVVLSVRDHGPGIADTHMNHIFDPFFTTKQAGDGLGLGLSISMQIVEELGGTMRACNHEVGGAVFTVDLPSAMSADEHVLEDDDER